MGGCCCVRAGCAGAWRACSPNDGQSRPKIGSQAARQSASSRHAWAPTRPRCAVYVGVAWPKVSNVEVGATAIILIFMSPALEKAPRTTANRTYEWTDTPPQRKKEMARNDSSNGPSKLGLTSRAESFGPTRPRRGCRPLVQMTHRMTRHARPAVRLRRRCSQPARCTHRRLENRPAVMSHSPKFATASGSVN